MFHTTQTTCNLHPVHEQRKRGSSAVSIKPFVLSDHRPRCSCTRQEALEDLLSRAASGQPLNSRSGVERTSERSSVSSSSSSRGPSSPSGSQLGRTLLASRDLQLGADSVSILGARGEELASIPLVLSDAIAMPTQSKDRQLIHGEADGYILAIAPRPSMSSDAEEHDVEPQVKEVWFLCLGNCDESGVERILFELGRCGAIRWELHKSYHVTKKSLGTGAAGTVAEGKLWQTPPNEDPDAEVWLRDLDFYSIGKVAVKRLKPQPYSVQEPAVRSEIDFLVKARGHPNISTLFGTYCGWEHAEDEKDSQLQWSIVMDLCDIDLFDYVQEVGSVSQDTAVEIFFGISSALVHLHSSSVGIVHRDLKPENILMVNSRPVVADFGLAAYLSDSQEMTRIVGSPGYAAPEVVGHKPYDEKVDIFAAGVVFWYVLSRTLPFQAKSLKETLAHTLRCKPNFAKFEHQPATIQALLRSSLARKPTNRPSADACCNAAWELSGPELRKKRDFSASYQAWQGLLVGESDCIPRSISAFSVQGSNSMVQGSGSMRLGSFAVAALGGGTGSCAPDPLSPVSTRADSQTPRRTPRPPQGPRNGAHRSLRAHRPAPPSASPSQLPDAERPTPSPTKSPTRPKSPTSPTSPRNSQAAELEKEQPEQPDKTEGAAKEALPALLLPPGAEKTKKQGSVINYLTSLPGRSLRILKRSPDLPATSASQEAAQPKGAGAGSSSSAQQKDIQRLVGS
eukprot:gb/GFBE01046732.1/.p1 GENE.gb/GFBE01046732.1/~~gb/GFBE01046732.1/.p1  ORF type:complete len:737 (+),score=113.07 gb/GFBE01046732.1/:1-2211(+)